MPPTSPLPSPSALPASHTSPSAADDLPTLLLQMQETITQIHETVTALQPHPSSSSAHGIASPEDHAKLSELESRRDSAIRSLLTAFSAESEYLSQKRRVEREEILERRRQEDEEIQKRRREEDEQWEERLRQEDERREKRLEMERQEVERETEELMGEIEKGWERRWEEEVGRLRGLEGRRKELNRLIEEKLQAHTEAPVALNAKAIRAARKASADKILEPELAAQAQVQAQEPTKATEVDEATMTKTVERAFLPAAAFESAPPGLDQDRDYNLESESHREEESTSRQAEVDMADLTVPFQEKMATMSMDDLLNEPNSLQATSSAVASRPTFPAGRTLSAVDMEETVTATAEDVPFETSKSVQEPPDVQERQLEVDTSRYEETEASTKTSPVDVEFQGLPIRAHQMDENLHLDEFAEVEEDEGIEKDEGEHCGLPVEHVVERAADVVEEFRGRHDSLGIIHPPATSEDHVDRGVAQDTAPAQPPSPDSESSGYTPYSQPTPASPPPAHRSGTDSPPNPRGTETEAEASATPELEAEVPQAATAVPDQEDVDTVPADADAHSISTASERGSYSDINEPDPAFPRSPTAKKAEEEDDGDADFVPTQDEETQAREAHILAASSSAHGRESNEVVDGNMKEEVPGEEVLKGLTGSDHEPTDLFERERSIAEVEDEWEDEHQKEHSLEHEHEHHQDLKAEPQLEDQQKQGQVREFHHKPEPEQEQALDAEAVDKEALENEVLQGLVDDPVGPAHDGRFELEEEAMRAKGVLEPHASAVNLAEDDTNDVDKYEEAESPVMGVDGVIEPPVTRGVSPSPGDGPENETEHEPAPVPVEELVREQEEMGLGRPKPHDAAELNHVHGKEHPAVNILDMDRHPLDHEQVSHVVGVALTHSKPVHMRHTPVEDGDEPAHYFVNQHHVSHSADQFYTPAEMPLRNSYHDQYDEKPDHHAEDSYSPRDHPAADNADDHPPHEPDVLNASKDQEDSQPRYHLYERPYTPSDFAPTPMESSFQHIEHADPGVPPSPGQGQPEVVVTPHSHHGPDTASDEREDAGYFRAPDYVSPAGKLPPGDELPPTHEPHSDGDVGHGRKGSLVENDDEIGHPLERVRSHQSIEDVDDQEEEDRGVSVDDFPVPGQVISSAERDVEQGPEHYIDRHHEDEVDGQEAVSSESESEDFEGRGGIVVHHLDAIAEEEDETVEEEPGPEQSIEDGVNRRDMAAEAEAAQVDAELSDEDDVRSIPADQSNITLPDEVVQSEPEINAEIEAEAEDLDSHPHDGTESAPADLEMYDTSAPTLARQQTDGTEATEDSDVDSSTEPSEPERIHEEDPDPRLSEEQPVLDEAPEIKPSPPAASKEHMHVSHESQLDEIPTQYQPSPEDDEYDPFRYSPPKKSGNEGDDNDDGQVVNEPNPESQEREELKEHQREQTIEHVEDDVRVDDQEQSDFERSSDEVLSDELKALRVERDAPEAVMLNAEKAGGSKRSLKEELEDVGSGGEESGEGGDGHDRCEEEGVHHDHLEEEDVHRHDHHVPDDQVAVDDQAGCDYRSSDEENETLADEEANGAYGHHHGHSHNHDDTEAQQPQHHEAPVLQLIEPSDTENGEFPSETSSISGHPHAVTREEVDRDWSEVDQFLSESDSDDEPAQAEHVEEAGVAAEGVAHAHPAVHVDIDAEVEAALETPAPAEPTDDVDIGAAVEAALETPATEVNPTEVASDVHDGHDGMHYSPKLAQGQEPDTEAVTHDDRHDQEDRPATPLDQPPESEQPEPEHEQEGSTATAAHYQDLPPLTVPATPPSPVREVNDHDHDHDKPEDDEVFIPRDVTNRPWRSDTVATADTAGTLPTISSPQSARSGTTLSSGPSSPVEESATSAAQDPRIRDSTGANIGRSRGLMEGTDYSGGGYGSYNDREPLPKGQKVMELWHERERSLSRTEQVRLSGESERSSSHNRRASGSGSRGASSGGGSSLFQRMRSVFEQSSAPAASKNNRVSMPSFFPNSHGSSPSHSSFLNNAAKQRPMSTSPYSSSRHHNDGYTPVETGQVEAEEAGEDSSLLSQHYQDIDQPEHQHEHHHEQDTNNNNNNNRHAHHRDHNDNDASEDGYDGYDEEYERERERRREERRQRRKYEREREEWRERHGMIRADTRYDYGEYRPE